MIYSAKLWDILGKNYWTYYGMYWYKIVGYICKTMGLIQKENKIILDKNYGIYWAKTIGNTMGYIWQNYEIYFIKYGIYLAKTMGYIGLRL